MDLLLTLALEDLPAELKPTCEQILKRAREVRKREPVVAYWCGCAGSLVLSGEMVYCFY
jgi:hypothetical protein